MQKELEKQVAVLVSLLVDGKYSNIERLTNGVRLRSDQIQSAIEQYGKALVLPPMEAYELMDVIEVQDSDYPRWSITMPLWTEEEGRSDLSIEITLEDQAGNIIMELDDIHVL